MAGALQASPVHPNDRWVARGLSLALHALLFLWIGHSFQAPLKSHTVIFSVETVSGLTPLGEGSGAAGDHNQITNAPANPNPLAGGLHLTASDAPVPVAPKTPAKPSAHPRPAAAAPTLADLSKRDEGMSIGLKPRQSQAAEEPSEGGMGNAHQAGAEGGVLNAQGAIAGRGYRAGDCSYGKPLPEESEVLVELTVAPSGEVITAQIKRTSGFPELDQHSLAKAREIVFDPLPAGVPQDPSTGTVLFKFEFNGQLKN